MKPLIAIEGRRILDRQLAVLRGVFETIALVGGETAWLPAAATDVPVIPDRAGHRSGSGLGPLAGLDAALAWLPSRFEAVVCVAGDMPFLSATVLARLRDAPARLAVVPRHARGAEPLCARYGRALGPLVASELAAGRLSLHRLLSRLEETPGAVGWIEEDELRAMDPGLDGFHNINDPGDLPA